MSFLRAHAAVTRQLDRELVAEHGLTINDYEVLLRLARAPDRMMRRVDLAQQVLLTPSGITRLLDGLQRCGFVEKAACDSDARVVYAKLTDAGRRSSRRRPRPRREHRRRSSGERFRQSSRCATCSARLLPSRTLVISVHRCRDVDRRNTIFRMPRPSRCASSRSS